MKRTKLMLVAMMAVMLMVMITSVFGFVSIPITRMQNAVHAYPPGTATGLTLQDAYDYLTSSDRDARMGTIGVLNRRTLILTPGGYTSTALVLDTHYVDIESVGFSTVSDTSGAVIDCGSVITRISNVTLDGSSIANCLTNDANAVCQSVTVTDGTNIQVLVDGLSGALTLDQTNTLFGLGSTFLEMTEISDPGAGAANIGRFYVRNSGGTTSTPYYQDEEGTETSMIGGAGATSLDAAYNTGSTIDVDGDAITATVSNTDNNRVLDLVQNDTTNNPGAFKITNAGTGISVDVDGVAGGVDWEGTGATSSISGAGAAIFTGLTTSSGATLFGDGTNTVAINSSVWDISTAGAFSGITTIGLSGDLTSSAGDIILADDKVLKGSVTITDTIGISAYDVDGAGYVQTIKLTNANTITAEIGTGVETVAVDSTTWDVSAAGAAALTGLTTTGTTTVNISVDAEITAVNIGNGAAAKTVALGSSNSTSTTTLLSGSGGLLLNASNNQPTLVNSGNSTGLTTLGNALSDISILGHIQGATAFILDGATDNALETTIAVTDPTADIIWTFPDGGADTLAFMGSTLTTNYPEIANSVTGGTSQLIFEGASEDTEETIIQATDPTADIIWILADGAADSLAILGSTLTTNYPDIANSIWGGTNQLIYEGSDVDTEETVLTVEDPTADNIFTFADDSGDVVFVAEAGSTTKDSSNADLPLTDAIVLGTSGGASAWGLPDGEEGQILTVQIVTDGGEATITPATCAGCGWATAVLTDDIDGISFLYVDDTVGWIVLGTSSDGTNIVALTQ